MSWSVTFIGTPEKVAAALSNYGDDLSGASKEEFESVFESLTKLVASNYSISGNNVIKLTASGHAYSINGVKQYSSCLVNLENIGTGVLV